MKPIKQDNREIKIKEILENNVWGIVCNKCGGGGSNPDTEEFSKCSKCNGNGITDWNYDLAIKKLLEFIKSL